MDPAFLRRIPYKIEVSGPSSAEFREIFRLVARGKGVEMPDDTIAFVVDELTERLGISLAAHQPAFLIEQALAVGKFPGVPAVLGKDVLAFAIRDLPPKDGPGYGMAPRRG